MSTWRQKAIEWLPSLRRELEALGDQDETFSAFHQWVRKDIYENVKPNWGGDWMSNR